MRSGLSPDTSPEIERLQIERWRAMTPAEKAALVTALTHRDVRDGRAGVRHRHPNASPRSTRSNWHGV